MAFDKTTVENRAPKNGVYQFNFTLYFDTAYNVKHVMTNLFLNDAMSGIEGKGGFTSGIAGIVQFPREHATIQVILKLSPGDRIYFKKTIGVGTTSIMSLSVALVFA